MNRTEYKKQHRNEHYDRLEVIVLKGEKEKIKVTAAGLGLVASGRNVNGGLLSLLNNDRNVKTQQGLMDDFLKANGYENDILE
ncbi:MAG: hypothetical protein PHN80_03220 [Hespellia sp.]|nr:hypothetical protein [Hespellia sp.]